MSKFFEIEPINLKQIVHDMCFEKYTDEQIVKRETEIADIMGCELDAPHHLEFVAYYYKLIRVYIQEVLPVPVSNEMCSDIRHCENISKQYSKLLLTDVALSNQRPSLVAATVVRFGLLSGYRDH